MTFIYFNEYNHSSKKFGKEYRMAIRTQNVILIKCCLDSCKIEKRNFFFK